MSDALFLEFIRFNHLLILLRSVHPEVIKEGAAARDFPEQATARGVILLMILQMLRQHFDLATQNGDLHMRRSGIFFVDAVFLDQVFLNGTFDGHDNKGGGMKTRASPFHQEPSRRNFMDIRPSIKQVPKKIGFEWTFVHRVVDSSSMESYVILGALAVGFGVLGWLLIRNQRHSDPHLNAELERRREEIGQIKEQLDEERAKHRELSAKGKEMYDRYKSLEGEKKVLEKERDGLGGRLTKLEATEERRHGEHADALSKLEASRIAAEDERQRVRRADENRLQRELEERDRQWAEHEVGVIAHLSDLCKQSELMFPFFTNVNLPKGFHGSLKPDFMIEFLSQYVIFDAKVSKSSNLAQYIADQVKKTAQKLKGNPQIYPTVFLVVPVAAIGELKKFSYYEEGVNFFIVPPQAVAPVLASLKRIEAYEFAKEMDPQERENIVDLVAHLNFHIATRNAIESYLIEHGVATLDKVQELNAELAKEIIVKREKMRHLNFNTAELKQLTANPGLVTQKLKELTKPQPKLEL